MSDLRRRAHGSGKTISKKAASRMTSRTTSAANSRTNSRAPSRHGSDDDEDGNMTDSTGWSVNFSGHVDEFLDQMEAGDDAPEAWSQDLHARIEEITANKRPNTEVREAALMKYVYLLMHHYAIDEIEKKTSELLSSFLKTIKAETSEKESTLALRAIEVTLITSPTDTAYEGMAQQLKRTYLDSEFPSVKAAAIHALSIAVIYGGAGDSVTDEVMDEFLEIIESDGSSIEAEDSGEVVTAALQAWGFLATYLDSMEDKTETGMDAFVEQLESSDISVQVAAGENIALLYEPSFRDRDDELDELPTETEDIHGHPIDNSHVMLYEVYRQKNQLEHTLIQLSKESSRRLSKKDRKTLHVNFADILNSVQAPWCGPRYQTAINQETNSAIGSKTVLRIHDWGFIKVNKWWVLRRLQTLRRVLGGGFTMHCEENEVVSDSLPISRLR